MAYVIAYRAQ